MTRLSKTTASAEFGAVGLGAVEKGEKRLSVVDADYDQFANLGRHVDAGFRDHRPSISQSMGVNLSRRRSISSRSFSA